MATDYAEQFIATANVNVRRAGRKTAPIDATVNIGSVVHLDGLPKGGFVAAHVEGWKPEGLPELWADSLSRGAVHVNARLHPGAKFEALRPPDEFNRTYGLVRGFVSEKYIRQAKGE